MLSIYWKHVLPFFTLLQLLYVSPPFCLILFFFLGVFPRDHKPDGKLRQINNAINERIAKLADGERVHFMDIGGKFLDKDGVLPKAIMPDFLHPKAGGYKIWAEAIEPKLKEFGL